MVFSNAGAVVYNRYGFFWRLSQLNIEMKYLRILFESQYVLDYNIARLLKRNRIVHSSLSKDPTYGKGIWLANQNLKCIIASPLTSNSVAKLTSGINDTLILNILSAGKKAEQLIGIFPTDREIETVTTSLPVRQKLPIDSRTIDTKICQFGALVLTQNSCVEYLSELCVGCRKCVEKYPKYFSVNDKMEIRMRPIDQENTQNLRDEFRIFHSIEEISIFISSL